MQARTERARERWIGKDGMPGPHALVPCGWGCGADGVGGESMVEDCPPNTADPGGQCGVDTDLRDQFRGYGRGDRMHPLLAMYTPCPSTPGTCMCTMASLWKRIPA